MSRARTLSKLFNTDGNLNLSPVETINGNSPSGRKNLVINGAMNVDQRNTDVNTNEAYSVDRYKLQFSGGAATLNQQDLTSSDSPYDDGFRHFLRLTRDTASSGSGDYVQFYQTLEAQDVAQSGWDYTSSSAYVTISFWARISLAGTYSFTPQTADGTSQEYVFQETFVANTWKKVTHTLPGNTNLQFDNNTGAGLRLYFRGGLGTDYTDSGRTVDTWQAYAAGTISPDNIADFLNTASATFDVTGLQLEVGETATSFEHRSFGEELLLCQRYFDTSSASIWYNQPEQLGSGFGRAFIPFSVQMRATPTMTVSTNNTNYSAIGTQFGNNKYVSSFLNGMTSNNYVTSWSANAEIG